jgi:TPR repeat protein
LVLLVWCVCWVAVAWIVGFAGSQAKKAGAELSSRGIANGLDRVANVAGDMTGEVLGDQQRGQLVRQTVQQILKIAEQGDAEAQTMLGLTYSHGDGVPQNHRDAMKWYRKAADKGNAEAQIQVAGMYDRGEGVPKSVIDSANWLRKAAEQGHTLAQTLLSMKYTVGQGVPQDHEQAFKWMREAALRGFPPAQHNIGGMYAEGRGVQQDYVEAYKWAIVSGPGQKTEVHTQAVNYLTTKMTPSQIAEATRLANEWRPT